MCGQKTVNPCMTISTWSVSNGHLYLRMRWATISHLFIYMWMWGEAHFCTHQAPTMVHGILVKLSSCSGSASKQFDQVSNHLAWWDHFILCTWKQTKQFKNRWSVYKLVKFAIHFSTYIHVCSLTVQYCTLPDKDSTLQASKGHYWW